MILDLLSIIAPLFVCAGLGFAWSRGGGRYDQELVTVLIMNFGAPCLVFSQLIALEVDGALMVRIAGGALAAMLAFGLIGAAVLRAARLPTHTYLGPLVFCNAGNMGLPLCLFAFGSEGLALATCFFAVMAVGHYTAGVWIWSGRLSPGELLRMPLSYAAALAVWVLVSGWPVPGWIQNTTELLGGLTIPLMLLTLGVSLSSMRLGRLRRTLALSLLRLGMGFGVGVGLSAWLELDGLARKVFIVECSMPVAVFNYIFAQRYGRDAEEVASLVLVSTVLAFALLPFLLAWLL